MFPRWGFARSVQGWAIKRVCKFLLKKKLGDFILGDIDLDQLDVQLSRGTIHLSDLALNVDLLNQKLAGSAVMVKEGSVGSLSIKIPLKLSSCEIEVEELELMLVPSVESCNTAGNTESLNLDADKVDQGAVSNSSASVSLDIHEGVKTIANIVKWFLTSFHIRLKNLIVAFDPSLDSRRSLVLRIGEIEYGTCVSEDPSAVSKPKVKSESVLGNAKLTNFAKFHGAVVEFLKMDDVDTGLQSNSCLGTSFSEWQTKSSILGSTATVLSGPNGGFSGKLNLSIPWKNGSLDIRKLDADFSVDPVELHLQPNTIKWIIGVWESVKNVGAASQSCYNSKTPDLFVSSLATSTADTGKQNFGKFSKSKYAASVEEMFPDPLLPFTHVIHDWVPLYANEADERELDQDYGASIDQFFECFDGMRSSQGGNSGIWSWTCSVFSAITVASNLASGSGHFPLEQQNVETSLKATIAEVSVSLYFHDELIFSHDSLAKDKHLSSSYGAGHGNLAMSDITGPYSNGQHSDCYMSCFSSMNTDQSVIGEIKPVSLDIHHLEARCQNLLFNLQICPQKTKFEASVMHFKVHEYHSSANRAEGFASPIHTKSLDELLLLNRRLQRKIQGSLPPFPVPSQEHGSGISLKSNEVKCQDGLVKVVLLESFGTCTCHCNTSSTDIDGKMMTSTSFSVNLPPFILWIHFQLLNVLLDLYKQIEKYLEDGNASKEFTSGVVEKQLDSSFLVGGKSCSPTYNTTMSSRACVQGKVVLPQARVILCFPSKFHRDLQNLTSLDKFIILELHPSLDKGSVSDLPAKPGSQKSNPCTSSTSISFSIGDFDLYLVDSAREDVLGDKCSESSQPIYASKILSGINKTGDVHSAITVVWQNGPVTGPWMAGRAWSLASKREQSRNKVTGKSDEFSSVTTGEDFQETSFHIRQELITSSAFLLHVRFSHVWVNLDDNAHKLLNQVINDISDGTYYAVTTSDEYKRNKQSHYSVVDVTQASILVDCDALDICLTLNEVAEITPSLQKELEGPWNSVRLSIRKFELLSVSNIGGVSDAKLFWLNHGEGDLWGSIFDKNQKAQEFSLIACRNSTIRRGDGKGSNALSFGSAGTTVLYLENPQLLQSFTSVTVQCGTIIAPGGRMDWVSAICLFFSSCDSEESSNDRAQVESSADGSTNRGSFFLDLVDVALSYEPHRNQLMGNNDIPDVRYDSADEFSEEIGEPSVACLLAAASVTLCNHTMVNSGNEPISYSIQFQDVGLLVCESSGSLSDSGCYYANYLRKTGYVKVAQVALVEAVLRIKGLFWEVDCSDANINLDTCKDTTNGLLRLVAQLQQIYAPDMEDAVAHLQSRWNTVQQMHSESISSHVSDCSDSSSVKSSSEKKLPASSDECILVGLLDEILENAFSVEGDTKLSPDHVRQSHLSDNNNSSITGDPSLRIPFKESMHGVGNKLKTSAPKICLPQIIESYYLSEYLPSSKSAAGSCSPNDYKSKFDTDIRREIECGKGGWYQDNSLKIVENHISKISNQPESASLGSEDELRLASSNTDIRREKGRILLKNIDVRWRMFAGFDWSKTKKETKCSSYLQRRDANKCLELSLSGLNVKYVIFPDGEINVSKLSVRVQDFHLYDRSRDAPWKMVIGYYACKDYPRESCSKSLKLDMSIVRPDPLIPIEDYRLCLQLLPMRLHLDQSQLNFLISFFSKGSFAGESPDSSDDMGGPEMESRGSRTFGNQTVVEEALLPFFQKFDVKPVVVCVDYIPRHIDMAALRRGNYAELLNLVPWKGIELKLKHVCAVGVYGWSSACETVLGHWLEDISHNQVHKLLKGLAPIKSLFAVSSGTSKLVSIPVKSYKKDQKLLKGMQRGAIAFLKSVSLEAVGLGVHLAAGAHELLLQAEYILTTTPPSVPMSESRVKTTVRSNQPEDAQQGIHQAYESLSEGLGRTASALVGSPLRVYQRGAGAGSALASAVRAAPAAAMAPVAASARAVHCTLLGVRNSLDPEHKKESKEKYLGPSRLR